MPEDITPGATPPEGGESAQGSAAAAQRSGSAGSPRMSRWIMASPCASTATMWLCS